MTPRTAFYLAACLLLPALWGWVVHQVFARLRLERYFPTPVWSEPEPAGTKTEELYYQI